MKHDNSDVNTTPSSCVARKVGNQDAGAFGSILDKQVTTVEVLVYAQLLYLDSILLTYAAA
jgi:hypothetical protein